MQQNSTRRAGRGHGGVSAEENVGYILAVRMKFFNSYQGLATAFVSEDLSLDDSIIFGQEIVSSFMHDVILGTDFF